MTETGMTIIFLPFITCLFWIILNPLVQRRDKTFRALQLLMAVMCISAFAMAGMSPAADGEVRLYSFFIRQFFTPLIIPTAILYIQTVESGNRADHYLLAGITIPASLLFAEIILMMILGPDEFRAYLSDSSYLTYSPGDAKIWKFIHLCSVWAYYVILALECVLFATIVALKAKRGNAHILNYIILPGVIAYAVTDVSATMTHSIPMWVMTVSSVVLSVLIFTTSYAGLFNGRENITLSDLWKGVQGLMPKEDNISKVRAAVISQGGNPETAKSTPDIPKESKIIADVHQSMAEEESLRIRFEDLIVTEQLFLKQGIRISDIASMLETNRTYVSRLVNNTYNMSFSDYINTLRIDYAEQYLLHNRDAKQSDIAAACGFPNASAFNNVFKKITGVTPKIWLATNA